MHAPPPPNFKRHIQLLILIHATAEFRKASVLNTKDWLSKKVLAFPTRECSSPQFDTALRPPSAGVK